MTTEALETQEVHNAIPTPPSTPVKFDVTANAIAEMQATAAALVIIDHEDKAGYKSVYDFRQVVKKQRIAVEKRQKELKAPHLQYNREVDAIAKELTGPMDDIETGLELKERAYNQERERIADELAKALRIQYDERTKQLRGAGFVYDAVADAYQFGDVVVLVDDIRELSPDDYTATADLIERTHQMEVARIAEEKRLADAERERIEQEKEKERKRLADENDKLKAQQKELKDKADALDALVLKTRTAALVAVGFTTDTPNGLNHPGLTSFVSNRSLLAYTDEQFTSLIDETNEYHKRVIQKSIDDAAAKVLQERNQKAADKAKKQADKARRDRLAPDRKTLLKFFTRFPAFESPIVSESESTDVLTQFAVRVRELATEFSAMAEEL